MLTFCITEYYKLIFMEWNITLISLLALVLSTALSLVAIPRIISVALSKRLFDVPDHQRKIHTRIVPYLGGVAIFGAAFLSSVLLMDHAGFEKWSYVRAAGLLLFFVGIKDDIADLRAMYKLIVQLIAAFIVVYLGGIRVENFYGLFGLDVLPLWFSYCFSIIGIAFVTNAFNLIDGIDGLAGSISAFATLVFGIFFAAAGQSQLAIVSFSLTGAILGFLYFNRSPAKIFMGDTGSLFIGYMLAVLSVCFVNSKEVFHTLSQTMGATNPAIKYTIVLAVLFVPIFDTLRVFAMRAARGISPFKADKHHLHHYLLDVGFSHNKVVLTLLLSSALLLLTCGLLNDLNVHLSIAALFTVAFGLFAVLRYFRSQRRMTSVSGVAESMQVVATQLNVATMDGQLLARTDAHATATTSSKDQDGDEPVHAVQEEGAETVRH